MARCGIYILKFSDKTIKIGRSKDIKRRVKQYRGGSPDGKGYQKMMYLYTQYEIKLEKKIHKFVGKKYQRIGLLEIFRVPENKHKKILKKIALKFADWRDVKISKFSNA